MRFDGFAGNAAARELLSACVDGERFPHALLLEGPEGSGRRTLAALIARAAVCSAAGGERPCGVCPGCRKAAAGVHPDIRREGGDGAARSFHIDVVRSVRDDAYILPNEAPRRVMILTGVQGMTDQAQNALLKILEEPPAQVVFVLTCDNRSALLPTVLSRTLCVTLGPVTGEEALPVLRERLPGRSDTELLSSLQLFGGLIGPAVRGLDDGSFQKILELTPRIAAAVAAPDELELLRATAALEKDRGALPGVLIGCKLIFRDALAFRCGCGALLSSSPETAEKLAAVLSRAQLAALLEAVDGLLEAVPRNMGHTLLLTLLCSRLRTAAGK
ncbi:MAG: ATP-binding protein [Clostridiales bacterium]|nr:ATP-binding protein [Clostridiales bacterium]